jgi:putative hydrolase of HD superfamily
MLSQNLQKVFKFTLLLNKFRQVQRGVLVNHEDRWENDIEHVCMLALMADYIISLEKLSLDRNKVIKYALAHDFVEIYAGDTWAYSKDKSHVDSKKDRERLSLERLKKEFPEHIEFFSYCEGYDQKIDDEAKFVYALDKLQPTIHIFLEDGKTWKNKGVSLEQVVAYKGEKMKAVPVIQKYWEELLQIMERNKEKLFPN